MTITEFLLIRHAVNDFVKTGRLAGWTPEVHLNEEGRAQAEALGERLKSAQIDAAYTSPLERCVETAQVVVHHHPHLTLHTLEAIGEVRYGTWQGAELSKLGSRKLWRAVQITPSRARFPGGEAMRASQMRAVDALEMLAERHPRERVAVFSHSDIIKMILAHYLGMHLDLFQRIDVSPASISILRLGFLRASIVQINETSYLPKFERLAPDERQMSEIRPVKAIVLDAIGEPGSRVFYLQASADSLDAPVTFVLEKTQALMLAGQVDELALEPGASADGEQGEPSAPPALTAPEKLMFRIGKIALQYHRDERMVLLTVEEMLGDGQGTPRTLRLWLTPSQAQILGAGARAVAARGRAGGQSA